MSRLSERSTADLIVIALTALVAVILIVGITGVILIELFRPNESSQSIAAKVGTLTNTLIGAIVGYLAGRSASSNGQEKTKSE